MRCMQTFNSLSQGSRDTVLSCFSFNLHLQPIFQLPWFSCLLFGNKILLPPQPSISLLASDMMFWDALPTSAASSMPALFISLPEQSIWDLIQGRTRLLPLLPHSSGPRRSSWSSCKPGLVPPYGSVTNLPVKSTLSLTTLHNSLSLLPGFNTEVTFPSVPQLLPSFLGNSAPVGGA